MHIFKKIFTILAIIFGSLGLMNIVSTDVALPLMYFYGINTPDNRKRIL